MGCRRIAHLHGPKGITVSQQRFKGYLDCLQKYQLPFYPELLAHVSFSADSAVEATMSLMDHQPDGIFGVNDEVCFGAMKVIREKNIRIPEEIALVGFDDIPLAQFAYPPLSSVSRQSRKIGEETALLFLAKIDGQLENKQISLEPQLIIRESSKKRII
jgi:LacI family transcriptional regulator